MDYRRQLESSIKPFIIFSSVFGMCPFSVKITETNSVKFSKIKLAHGFCVTAFLVGFIGFTWFSPNEDMDVYNSSLAQFNAMVYPVMICAIFSGFLFSSKNFCQNVDDVFNFASIITNKSFYSNYFWIVISGIFFFEILLIINLTLYTFLYNSVSDLTISSIVDTFFHFTLSSALLTLYLWPSNLLYYLKSVLQILNVDLCNIAPVAVFVPRGKYKLFRDRSKFGTWLVDKTKDDVDLLSLVMIYNRVIDTCIDLNNCINVTSLGFTCLVMLDLVLSLYEMVEDSKRVSTAVSWITWIVLIKYFLLYSCEKVVNEVSMVRVF